jgi:hypothetical protein
LPAARYFISQSVTAFYHNPVCIYGDGAERSTIKLDAGMTGPALSWSEDWFGGTAISPNNADPTLSPIAANLSIAGDVTTAGEQDGIALYDRNDRVIFSHVTLEYLWGRAASAGALLLNTTAAYMREGYWQDVYSYYCGNPAVPVFEFNSVGNGDSTNTDIFEGLQAWHMHGQGLVIRNQNTVKATTYLQFDDARIENDSYDFSEDLIQIGDWTQAGSVSNVVFRSPLVIAVPAGANGISFRAQAAAYVPHAISFLDTTLFGVGNGINVGAGTQLRLDMVGLTTNGPDITTGGSTLVTVPIVADGHGFEKNWTYAVTSGNQGVLLQPVFRTGDPTGVGTGGLGGGFSANVHDGTATGGTALAVGSVDLQMIRASPAQIAGSQYSTLSGGRLNSIQAGGIGGTICGGSGNTIGGQFSFGCGQGSYDYGLNGHFVYASSQFSLAGDGQFGLQPLTAATTGNSPALMTAGNGTTASVANQLNIPASGGAFGFDRITAVGFDPINVHACMWYVDGLLVRRTNAAAASVIVGTPTITQSACDSALTASTLTVAADTTTGGLDFVITGVTGVNMHVVGIPHMAEVR